MIRLRLGRRVSAFALSFLLLSASVLPAFASSGQLQTVGWAETVSSFLMASGIYPFESDEETGYQEWSVSSLKTLWDEFRDDTTQVAYDIVDLTGSLAKGVIAIASGRWSVLREFATWIVNKYSVTDNQTGLELGEIVGGWPEVPVFSGNRPSDGDMLSNGFRFHASGSYTPYLMANVSGVFACWVQYSGGNSYNARLVSKKPYSYAYWQYPSSNGVLVYAYSANGSIRSFSEHGVTYTYYYTDIYYWAGGIAVSGDSLGLPLFFGSDDGAALDSAGRALYGFGEISSPEFQGVTANTTTVSIPAALPEGEDFGGLVVAGAGANVTLEQLQTIIQTAVTESLQPLVTPVGVVVAPSVDLTPGGEIVETPVEITPGDIPLQSSDYSVPNLTSVFPFSIPWDIMSIYSALNAEPVRPSFDANVYIPVLDTHVPFHIGVTDETADAVDNAMALWRNMLLILLCVGTLWFFWGHFGG